MTQEYVGTKIVTAWPQAKGEDEGYAVKYSDGYVSWSPKATFESAYLALGQVSHLPDWHQRLLAEGTELSDKIEKLMLFRSKPEFHSLPRQMQEAMHQQLQAMTAYLEALTTRERLLQAKAPS